jgi:heme-degrading monooxygenase HmoA
MIARTWRGATVGSDAERYAAYLRETGVADCRALPGNLGVLVLRRSVGERAEFEFISFWEDEVAVRRFAGPDPERAVFYPADDAFLVERETLVTHWEVVETAAIPGGQGVRDPAGSSSPRR